MVRMAGLDQADTAWSGVVRYVKAGWILARRDTADHTRRGLVWWDRARQGGFWRGSADDMRHGEV